MYIWILLASIMVAFSFYNISPRVDKENAYSEIKAATVTRRFRMEHLAFSKTMECPVIYNSLNLTPKTEWDPDNDASFKDDKFYPNFKEGFAANLPIGYNYEKTGNTHHVLYCITARGFTNQSRLKTDAEGCSTRNVWAVSYMPIPERWLSKASSNPPTPIPAFTNFLGSELLGLKNSGWIYCHDADIHKCQLIGRSAWNGHFDGVEVKINEVTFPQGILMNEGATGDPNFVASCVVTPCMFAYERIKHIDVDDSCKSFLPKEEEEEETPPAGGE